jgi:hypothetical protein
MSTIMSKSKIAITKTPFWGQFVIATLKFLSKDSNSHGKECQSDVMANAITLPKCHYAILSLISLFVIAVIAVIAISLRESIYILYWLIINELIINIQISIEKCHYHYVSITRGFHGGLSR